MNYLDMLILITAPLMVGCVIGAWLTTGRLYTARLGGVILPVWLPAIVTVLASLIGLIIIATQIIATSGAFDTSSSAERSALAILSLFINPVWTGSASLAVLGLVLHYTVDNLLALLRLDELVQEGLARGLRASWALIGVLVLLTGLQSVYGAHLNAILTSDRAAYQLFLHILTIALTIFCMAAPLLIEQTRRRKAERQKNSPQNPSAG